MPHVTAAGIIAGDRGGIEKKTKTAGNEPIREQKEAVIKSAGRICTPEGHPQYKDMGKSIRKEEK